MEELFFTFGKMALVLKLPKVLEIDKQPFRCNCRMTQQSISEDFFQGNNWAVNVQYKQGHTLKLYFGHLIAKKIEPKLFMIS